MRWYRPGIIGLLLVAVSCAPARADKLFSEFLTALRARGYNDTALEYLQRVEQNPASPRDVVAVVPYERAVTLLQMSRLARTSQAKQDLLNDAQAALQLFIGKSADHPLAGRANSELGRILFERARALVWQADSPANTSSREELRGEARTLIASARTIFQRAFDLFNTQLKSFPSFIDEDDKETRAAYQAAQIAALSAQLDLARCTYERGQTYNEGSKERKDILIEASKEFVVIHEQYRTWVSGVTARMWQAKCFEELDDIRRALGIYNEVLGHGDENADLRNLKDLARRFRLTCLNKNSDFALAIQEAETWLKEHATRSRTENGLGIRWEKARAHEAWGKSFEAANDEHERQLKLALSEAKDINRYAGPYREVSGAMVRRLKAALGQNEGEPKDFDTAFEIARALIEKVTPTKQAVAAATNAEERRKKQDDLKLQLEEAGGMLSLALELADGEEENAEMLQARYLLAYIKYEQRASYDSVILARYVMKYGAAIEPETALNSAEVALAGCSQAYNTAGDDNAAELRLMESVSNQIIAQWPDSDRANDARMSLGMVHYQANQPQLAEKWYNAVPKTAPQYAEAQIAAGQAWWEASLAAGRPGLEDAERPAPEELKAMTESAEKFLRSGLKEMGAKITGRPSASYTAARLSLAQILNTRGAYDETIKIIAEDEHAIVKQIRVPDGAKRPAKGVRSQDFASLTYQVLLRAYVGKQEIDKALAAMTELEKIGGEANTRIYVQLGRELEREINRLKELNDQTRLTELRSSFERFLDEVFQRKDNQNYNALIWVAETYLGLGQGMSDDPAAATTYFGRAADAYEQIIANKLVTGPQLTAVRLRLVNCRRSMLDFQSALKLVEEILAQQPRDVNAQFEAAYVLKDWGGNGEPERLLQSINGIGGKTKTVWGWSVLSDRLGRLIDAGQARPEFHEKYYEARFASAESRREYGLLQNDSAGKQETLEAAKGEIEVLVAIDANVTDAWWDRFDTLYQGIQSDLGERILTPLERPEVFQALPQQVASQDADPEPTETVAAAVTPAPQSDELSWTVLLAALVIASGAVAGLWYLMSKPRKAVRPAYAASVDFGSVSTGQPRRAGSRPASAASGKSPVARKKSAGGKPRTAEGGTAARKPRAERSGGDDAAGKPTRKVRKPRPESE